MVVVGRHCVKDVVRVVAFVASKLHFLHGRGWRCGASRVYFNSLFLASEPPATLRPPSGVVLGAGAADAASPPIRRSMDPIINRQLCARAIPAPASANTCPQTPKFPRIRNEHLLIMNVTVDSVIFCLHSHRHLDKRSTLPSSLRRNDRHNTRHPKSQMHPNSHPILHTRRARRPTHLSTSYPQTNLPNTRTAKSIHKYSFNHFPGSPNTTEAERKSYEERGVLAVV